MRARLVATTALAAGLVVSGITADAHGGSDKAVTQQSHEVPAPDTPNDVSSTKDTGLLPPAPMTGPKLPVPVEPRPAKVGVQEPVNVTLDGDERTERFHYPGARYVKVHFEKLELRPGDRVTVSDPDRKEVYTYPRSTPGVTLPVVPESDEVPTDQWAYSVTGDTAVVTVHPAVRPARQPDTATGEALKNGGPTEGADVDPLTMLGDLRVVIDKVARGFNPQEQPPAAPGSEESTCGNDDKADAICYRSRYAAEYAHSRPVAKLLIDGTTLCTGWRVGPHNRMLTNHHCFSNNGQARQTEVWFDYECVACGDDEVGPSVKVSADRVIDTDRTMDYTLFTVDDFSAVKKYGYLELATSNASPGEDVYVPQHADGKPKQIALASDSDTTGACQVDDATYTGYAEASDVSYYCDTSQGSSGSPILSRDTHEVVALHHFGGCPNSGVRGDLLYRKLKNDI